MTQQQLEEKIIELLANTESYEDAMKDLAAYVREETLREVFRIINTKLQDHGSLSQDEKSILNMYLAYKL